MSDDEYEALPEEAGQQQDPDAVAGPDVYSGICPEVKFKKEGEAVRMRFSGREIFLARGIGHYQEHKSPAGVTDGLILYGNTGERIDINKKQVAVFYRSGSNIQFSLKKPIGSMSFLLTSVTMLGVEPEAKAKENPKALEEFVELVEGDEVCNVDGGKRRKKTRARKSKRRRTLRKQK